MASRQQKMDAVALLKADHRKVEELFAKFEKARDDERKRTLVKEICTELAVHCMIEEEIFYPACTGKVEDDTVDEAYVEHDGAKVLIAELMQSDPDNEFYDAKVKVLSEDIKHHVKEEEKRGEGLFAQARAAGLDLEALGEQLEARKEELLAEFSDGHSAAAADPRFTGHMLEQGTPVGELFCPASVSGLYKAPRCGTFSLARPLPSAAATFASPASCRAMPRAHAHGPRTGRAGGQAALCKLSPGEQARSPARARQPLPRPGKKKPRDSRGFFSFASASALSACRPRPCA